jgi:hypothetical protein
MRLSSRPKARATLLCIAIKRACRSLTDARRRRDRAVAERTHRLAPDLVHASVVAAITVSFAVPVFVAILAHNDPYVIVCPRFASLKVLDAWMLASWGPTALLWILLRWWARARWRRLAHQLYIRGKAVQG